MAEIVESVKRVTDITGEFAAASYEQTQGIEQINQALVEEAPPALQEQASGLVRATRDVEAIAAQPRRPLSRRA